jgi:hypothetical protein
MRTISPSAEARPQELDTVQYGQRLNRLRRHAEQNPIPYSGTGVGGRTAAPNLPGRWGPKPRVASVTEVERTSDIAQEEPMPAAGVSSL